MSEEHKKCKKKTRWYQTCNCVWGDLKQVSAETGKQKNGDIYGLSDQIDDLIVAKHKEVFPHIQKSN